MPECRTTWGSRYRWASCGGLVGDREVRREREGVPADRGDLHDVAEQQDHVSENQALVAGARKPV